MTVVDELRSQIQAANKAYWQDAKPIMTDIEYDKLIRKLAKLSPNDPILSEIGKDNSSGQKVEHKKRMYSLAKVYSIDAFLDWASKVARGPDEVFACSCKFDGISVEIADHRLITRGDGIIGTDITHLAKWIICRLTSRGSSEVMMSSYLKSSDTRKVGELMIPLHKFQELRKNHPEFADYKTCRNLAAGFANLKADSPLLKSMTVGDSTIPIATWVYHQGHELKYTLKELMSRKIDLIEKLRDDGGFPSDGIVVRLDDRDYANSLGFTGHHPQGAMAIKFSDDSEYVQLDHIDWQVGEQRVTPVAVFAPTEIGGVVVQKATLHCPKFIKENRVTPGCELLVERRGGVIPKVIRVTPDESKPMVDIPTTCPVCGSALVESGAYVKCPNDKCKAGMVNRICRGLEILGCKGIGPALCTKLISEFYLEDIIDVFDEPLDRDVLEKKGFSASSIKIILTNLDKITTSPVTTSKLLRACCIPMVGKEFAQSVVNNYPGGIDALLEVVPVDRMYDELIHKPGIELPSLTNFMVWMELNKERFVIFRDMFVNRRPDKAESNFDELVNRVKALTDKKVETYCFTGSGPIPRNELIEHAYNLGHRTTDNANQCTVLVAADPTGNSSKLRKARAAGKPIISYEAFMKLFDAK